MKLEGKTVVITGAAGGLGSQLVHELCKADARCVALDWDAKGLEQLLLQAKKWGYTVDARQLDIQDNVAVAAEIEKLVKGHNAIDVWINNAGITRIGSFGDMTEFEKVMSINFTALANCTKLVLDKMEQRGQGTIVNIASVAGHVSAPFMVAYTASKHAVVGFTRSLSAELHLRDSPVKTLLVSPGFVDTAIIAKGASAGFPEWLSFLLAKPTNVAKEIVTGLRRGRREIFPTVNGKLVLAAHTVAPLSTRKASRFLLSKSWKDAIMMRFTPPD
jgi:short-subunit dehydrogenase